MKKKAGSLRVGDEIVSDGIAYKILRYAESMSGNTFYVHPNRPSGKGFFCFYRDNEVEVKG